MLQKESNFQSEHPLYLLENALASEESCITSLSECISSASKHRFERMSNPSHAMDDDPDATSTPPSSNNWWTSMLLSSSQSQHSPSDSAIAELDTLNWPSDLSTATSTTDSSIWSHILAGGNTNEFAMQNLAIENLQDMFFSRVLRQGNELLFPDQNKKMDEMMQPWDLPLRSFTFQGDDINMATMEKHIIEGDRLSSTTCTLPDMEAWSATIAAQELHSNDVAQTTSLINPFTSSLELPSSVKQEYPLPTTQYESHRIKQELYPFHSSSEHSRIKRNFSFPNMGGNSSTAIAGASAPSSLWLQGFAGADNTYKADRASFLAPATIHDEFLGKWPGSQSARLACPVQLLSKQPSEIFSARTCHAMDLSSLMSGINRPPSQPMERKSFRDASLKLRTPGRADDVRETTADPERNPGSMNCCESTSEGLFKRPRVESAPSTHPYKQQVRKEKLGDRITALQQLVSPFGKTDTASVLLEAIGYIKFLQEQVQVLSTPYMKTGSSTTAQADGGKKNQDPDEPKLDLRSRGLCLVPVSCTMHVANENGADFWAPSLGAGYR